MKKMYTPISHGYQTCRSEMAFEKKLMKTNYEQNSINFLEPTSWNSVDPVDRNLNWVNSLKGCVR